jgi:hypothetical protein
MGRTSGKLSPPWVPTRGQYESTFIRVYQGSTFRPCISDISLCYRYSDRKEGHWFQGGQDGNSYAGLNQSQKRGQLEPEHVQKLSLPASEPISADVAEDGRLRRTEFSPTTVEKFVIKGSMSKVVSPTTLPFQRLLLSGST